MPNNHYHIALILRPIEILPGLEPPLRGKGAEGIRMLFILEALRKVTGERRVRIPDLGGSSTTEEFAAAVTDRTNS
jgi:hypothetical protein